ncbi:MAG TPA: N-formylglutamate amidohydrolase, partial [Telluria sp.]
MDFRFRAGSAPLLISMPHVGTDIPDDIAADMAPIALARADTDWHLEQLYAFAEEMGASTLAARWSRYVIDVNRPPEDTNLYPGLDTTGLCPVDTFARAPLYQ